MNANERFESEVLARCTKCGHSAKLFVDDKSVRDEMKRAFSVHAVAQMMKLFWRGWVFAFVLGVWAEAAWHLLWHFLRRLF